MLTVVLSSNFRLWRGLASQRFLLRPLEQREEYRTERDDRPGEQEDLQRTVDPESVRDVQREEQVLER